MKFYNKILLERALGAIMFTFVLMFILYSCVHVNQNKSEHLNYIKTMNDVYDNRNDSPYPNQNFLFLKKSIVDLNDDQLLTVSTASGIGVKRVGNTIYGLTAAHWCNDISDPSFIPFSMYLGYENLEEANKSMTIEVDYFGKQHNAEIIDIDLNNDICLIKFDSEYSKQLKKIKLAKSYPKLGEKIYAVSAPLSVKGHDIRLHFEGYFSGCIRNEPLCFYTIPGTNGSSGSGIVNSKGELVGILTVSIVGFHDITGGVRIPAIKAMLDKI